ncbi:hypothetical protein B0H63DRAFT_492462 [Podospora didyma]|uniref:Enoyl reductase (ER) domain-containing protein n=1 Tax=Podospora didyma TaxID=330526 RepID=A0AAE0NXH6_9PEZI|nr:hypothetical protein B0H63DRAFT_492462 [Podospora didyma]
MKAWRYANGITAKTLVGRLENSIILDTKAPMPDISMLAEHQVVVQVISAALNPADFKMPESDWFGRMFGLGNDAQPGMDFSGRIVSKHPSNTTYKEGQLVFGSLAKASKYGTLGQFAVASTSELAALPPGVNPDQAAALGTSAGTAYSSLRSLAGGVTSTPAQRHVFINGGSGGVGTYAIQFAKIMGATVTTSTSTANIDTVRQLGADHVIDYKQANVLAELKRRGQVFDMVIDNVGTPQNLYDESHKFLKTDGTYVQVALNPTFRGTWDILVNVCKSMLGGGQRRKFQFVTDKGGSKEYAQFGQWVADLKLVPVIGNAFALDLVPEAYARLREGRSVGKIVVHVSSEAEADKLI